MKMYSNATVAISDLHMQGFAHDFYLSGNDLLWMQEGLLTRAGEFAIVRHCKIQETKNSTNNLSVFGIIALCHNIKGILLSHLKDYPGKTPPVLVRKLNDLNFLEKNKTRNSHLNLNEKLKSR